MRRKLIFLSVTITLVLIIFGLFKTIYKTYLASGRVGNLEQEVQVLESRQSELEQEALTKDTLAFVEREARNKLGMVKPGEQIVVIGEVKEEMSVEEEKMRELSKLPNRDKWWLLFFGEDP